MFHGSIVAIVTPMQADESIDYEALRQLVEFHIEQGTNAIVAAGTTGEAPTLNMEEHCAVIRVVVEQSRGRIPVIAGTGSNSTHEAIELTQYAKDVKVDACLLVTPYYNKPTQEGLYRHFRRCAEAVAIPQILYNVPGRTGVDLLPKTIERLSDIPNIIGIKEASGKIARITEIYELCSDRMAIYTGDDATALAAILNGAQGDISVTANVAPQLMRKMCELALADEKDSAQVIDNKLALLHKNLFIEANPIPVKWALQRMGLIPAGIRLPLTPLSDHYHELIEAALHAAALI